MDAKYIYKIFRPAEWDDFSASGVFRGSADDVRDGFIHFSTAMQLAGTLAKYYTDGVDIVLAEVDGSPLGDDLKYEVSRNGAAFPHLYGALSIAAINRHWVIAAKPDASYVLPELE